MEQLETMQKLCEQGWIDDPTSRLPVSCTVINVTDSMDEGRDSIENSWRFVSHALRYGAGVAVHLSKLRGRGAEDGPAPAQKVGDLGGETAPAGQPAACDRRVSVGTE